MRLLQPVLKRTQWAIASGLKPRQSYFVLMDIIAGNPAFAGSDTGGDENYMWGQGSSNPRTLQFYNGSTSGATFPNGGTWPVGQYFGLIFRQDTSGKTLEATVEQAWEGSGAYTNANLGGVIYGDYITAGTDYRIGILAAKTYTEREPTVSIGPEIEAYDPGAQGFPWHQPIQAPDEVAGVMPY